MSAQLKQASPGKTIRACSIWRATDLLGDKPTLLILEAYWLGVRRFGSFIDKTGLLRTVVSDRLQKLVAADCMQKRVYSRHPLRHEYVGTRKLHSAYPVALSMLYWERHHSESATKLNPTLCCRHCSHNTQPKPVCNQCCESFSPDEVEWLKGPGASFSVENYHRRRRSSSHREAHENTELFDTVAGIIGDRWSVLILRSLFTDHSTFLEIQSDTQIASNILSERLKWLLELNILSKQHSSDDARQAYQLTNKGRDLYPILLTLMAWGDAWYSDVSGPPVTLRHKACGETMNAVLICANCGHEMGFRDVSFNLAYER